MPEQERPIPAPVKGLSAVSLFNDFASEMVYPVLPAFVTGPLGGSALALGALDGLADLTAALVKWASGRLADRSGWTKPLILVGYGMAVLIRPVISVASAAWQVIGFRVIDRVGKGIRSPPRDALIAVSPRRPCAAGRSAFNRAMDHLGGVLGSVAAWALAGARHRGAHRHRSERYSGSHRGAGADGGAKGCQRSTVNSQRENPSGRGGSR